MYSRRGPVVTPGEPIVWRAMRRSDARGLHRLLVEAGQVDDPAHSVSRREVARGMRDPRFTPGVDGVVGVARSGAIVAAASARLGAEPERSALAGVDPHREVALEATVHPAWRGRGVGRVLLERQVARGRRLLEGARSAFPGRLVAGAREVNVQTVALLEAAAFHRARSWLTLDRSAACPPPHRGLPAGMRLERFRLGLSEATRVALNDAFRDHWGFAPLSRAEWRRDSGGDFAPKLSRLVVSGRGTRQSPLRVEAFALTELPRRDWARAGSPFGRIATVGVVRGSRGLGLSTVVVAEAIRAYGRAGLLRVELDVDATNPSGALGMYERLGFRERDRAVTYALTP